MAEPEGETPQVGGAEAPAPTPARARRRRGRFGLWLLLSLVLLVAAAGFGVLALTGKALRLPVWAVAEVETRLNTALQDGIGPGSLSVGGIEVTVGTDWVPRLRLDDVRLLRVSGEAILTLPEARITFDPGALTQGKVRARSLSLVGARITLRRDRDGRFDLDVGTGVSATQVDSFAALLDRMDAVFALPALTHLRRIDAEALTMTLEDARAGRVWQMGDGRFTLENREAELAMELGLSLVGGGETPAQAALTFVTRKDTPEARVTATVDRVAARDLAAQAAPLAWLGVLDAPISGQLTTALDAGGALSVLEATLSIEGGALQPIAEARPIAFDRAGLYVTYDAGAEKLTLSEITVESPSLRLAAKGHVYLPGVARGLPDTFLAQIDFDQVMVDPEGLFQEPVRFSDGALDLRLRLDPFAIDIGQLALVEDGRRLIAQGRATAAVEGWRLALDLGLDAIAYDRLLALWPVGIVPRTRAWLAENVLEGNLFDVKAALRLVPGQAPRLSLGYEFKDGDVRFLKTLPPIRKGSGYATIEGNTYTMVLDKGQVTPEQGGTVDMAGSVFSVLDITQRPSQAEIRLKTDSTVTAALSLLDEAPFNFMTKAGRPVALGEGRARLDALLRLPLVKKVELNDVRYEVAGRLTNLRSEVLVPGRVLTADALDLTANPRGMTIAGPGRIGAVAFDVTYAQGFRPEDRGRATVKGQVELSPATVKEFDLGLPEGMVSGKGLGEVDLALQRGEAPRLSVTSTLAGVGLRLPQLGWEKARGAKGRLRVEARLGKPASVDKLELAGAGLEARGRVSLRPEGGLDVARFDRVRLNGWLDAAVSLTGRGTGRAPDIAVTGGRLDLRGLTRSGSSSGGQGGGSGPMSVTLDRLTVSDGIALTGFRGRFATQGGLNGSFTARVNDTGPVRGEVVPARGGTAVRIASDDAGAVLAAAGVFKNARGGALELELLPAGTPGHYAGTARASNFRVRNTPVLAELLNAISVVGLLEQLNGSGLQFAQADVEFRLTPRAIEVTRGAAVGASLGVSMAGLYDLEAKRMQMQGVISPIYLLNSIGSVLTRRGEGLFGFNYQLTGTADDPQVSVNPLSILTPGMFREIFRRPPPTIEGQE